VNYKSSRDFQVAGSGKESITIATYENGQPVLVATKSTEYMNEQSVEIPLTDVSQVEALIKELQSIKPRLTSAK
jgi:hypothetical protein